jgi:hypothetical protein
LCGKICCESWGVDRAELPFDLPSDLTFFFEEQQLETSGAGGLDTDPLFGVWL